MSPNLLGLEIGGTAPCQVSEGTAATSEAETPDSQSNDQGPVLPQFSKIPVQRAPADGRCPVYLGAWMLSGSNPRSLHSVIHLLQHFH